MQHVATKADLERAIHTLTWRMIGALAAFGTLMLAAIRCWA